MMDDLSCNIWDKGFVMNPIFPGIECLGTFW
jgi:hypothetical protein